MRIIGLMSGTSYDAIEVAAADLVRHGDTLELTRLGEVSVDYDGDLRESIAEVLPPNSTTIEQVCRLHSRLGRAYAAAAGRGVELAGGAADLVVSHGQTVYHWVVDGRARGTLQLGAPAWIAERTGVPVLSDLRTADIARGGQGAPLVPIVDALLLGATDEPRAALNLGGIANLTVVNPDGTIIGYDVGPANALLDAATRKFYKRQYDVDGQQAAKGTVDRALLETLLAEPYYARRPPKSTGKELFHAGYLPETTASPENVLATLTELTARIVADECRRHRVAEVVASGGGTNNLPLMARLAAALAPARVSTTDELGIPSAAKEAYAFAVLGWLAWHGLPGSVPSVTGARAPAVLGSWTPGAAGLSLPAGAATLPRRLVPKV